MRSRTLLLLIASGVTVVVVVWGCYRFLVRSVEPVSANPGVLVQLPPELHYLIEPVLRCGCRSEQEAFAYLDNANAEQMKQLGEIAERVLKNDHYPLVMKFLDKYKMTDYDECAKLYFFFGVLDHGGFKFDRVPDAK